MSRSRSPTGEAVSVYGFGLVMLSLLALVHSPLYADWPQRRHDAAHTGCTDEQVRPPLELRWQFADLPEIDPDTLPPEAAAEWQERMEELDRSGEMKYRAAVPAPGRRSSFDQREWVPHVLAAGNALFVQRDISGIICLDRDTGEVRWRRPPSCHRFVALERDTLVLFSPWHATGDCRGLELAGCNAATGEVTWLLTDGELAPVPQVIRGRASSHHVSVPAVREGQIAICAFERWGDPIGPYVYLLDVRGGPLIDRKPCLPPGAPVDPNGVSPYVGCLLETRAWGRRLMLLGIRGAPHHDWPWALGRAGEVTAVWPRDACHAIYGPRDLQESVGLGSHPDGAVLGEEFGLALCFENIPAPLRLTARDAATGEWIWSVSLASPHNGHYWPVVGKYGVYLGLADGVVYALDPQTGGAVWQTRVGAPLLGKRPSPALFAPICSLAGDTLWVVYRGTLIALGAATGERLWQTEETDATWCEPVVSDGFVYLFTGRRSRGTRAGWA
jgi:outer membrane protein assembly factor BamB